MSTNKEPPKIHRVPRDMLWRAIQELDVAEFCSSHLVPAFPLARLSALSSGLTAFGAMGRLQRTGKRTLSIYGEPVIWFRINPDYVSGDGEEEVPRDKPADHDPEKLLASLMGSLRYEDFIPGRLSKSEFRPYQSRPFCS